MKSFFLSLACYLHAFLFSYMARRGLILFDVDPKAIEAELKRIGDQVKDFGEKALAEAKKGVDTSASNKEQIDKLLAEKAELSARLLEVEQKQARQPGPAEDAQRTAGEMVVQSEELKRWMAAGGPLQRSSVVIPLPRAAIMTTDTSNTTTVGVAPDRQPGVIPGTQRRLTVRDLISPGRTTADLIQYVRETGFTNNAAPVSEGDKKPQSELTYDMVQTAVTTIAHFFKASKQILADFAQLESQINARGMYGLKLAEENQLLKGTGVGINLNGIYTQATAFSAPIALAGSVTMIDTIRLMLLQAELAEYPSTGIVLHPSDWAKIELTKDANRQYIFANPRSMISPGLWGLPIVATQAMTVDTALVGAFALGAQIFDREDANAVIATQNEDDFVKNMITIRIEERLALAVYRPAAFIKNTNLPAS